MNYNYQSAIEKYEQDKNNPNPIIYKHVQTCNVYAEKILRISPTDEQANEKYTWTLEVLSNSKKNNSNYPKLPEGAYKKNMAMFEVVEAFGEASYNQIVKAIEKELEELGKKNEMGNNTSEKEHEKKFNDELHRIRTTRVAYIKLKDQYKDTQEKLIKLIDEWHEYTYVLWALYGENNYFSRLSKLDYRIERNEYDATLNFVKEAINKVEKIEKRFEENSVQIDNE